MGEILIFLNTGFQFDLFSVSTEWFGRFFFNQNHHHRRLIDLATSSITPPDTEEWEGGNHTFNICRIERISRRLTHTQPHTINVCNLIGSLSSHPMFTVFPFITRASAARCFHSLQFHWVKSCHDLTPSPRPPHPPHPYLQTNI